MANNANIHTFVSPQFNGSFWTIGDNPITRPNALSQALKIGGYIFDGAQILWDGAQQAQLLYDKGKPDPKLAQDVVEQLNDPTSEITINWNAVSQRPIANQTYGGFVEIGIPNNLYMDGKIYRDTGVFSGIGGGANWGTPDKSRAVLDIGQASANLHALASNSATIPFLTSSRCTLTGNLTVTGTSTSSSIPELSTNNLTSNVCVVSNLYATTIDAENLQVDGNLTSQSLRVLGNLQANAASIPHLSTESLTGNIVVCSNLVTSTLDIDGLVVNGNAVCQNLSVTGNLGSFQGLTGNVGTFQNLSVTGNLGSFQGLTGNVGTFQNLSVTGNLGSFQGLTGNVGTFQNLSVTGNLGSFQGLTGNVGTFQNLSVTGNLGSFQGLTGNVGTFQNLSVTGNVGSFQGLAGNVGSFLSVTGNLGTFQNITSNVGTFGNLFVLQGNSNARVLPQVQSDWLTSNISSAGYIVNRPTLSNIALTGSYADLLNKPIIPAQVQSDWASSNVSAVNYILNKPLLSNVAISGSYNDLVNKPTIPGQVQADWNASNSASVSYILNKPNLAIYAQTSTLSPVAITGSYNSLVNRPTSLSAFTNDQGFIAGNTSFAGNVITAARFIGNGSQLTGLSAGSFTGVISNSQLPTHVNIGGTLQANGVSTFVSNIAVATGTPPAFPLSFGGVARDKSLAMFHDLTQFYGMGAQDGSLKFQTAGTHSFFTNSSPSATGTERVRILATGSVGINNTAPIHTLSVNGNVYTSGWLFGGVQTQQISTFNGVNANIFTLNTAKVTNSYAYQASVGLGYNSTTAPANSLIVQGSVGVGTSQPGFPLSFGAVAANKQLALFESGTTDFYGFGAYNATLQSQSKYDHAWYTGGSTSTMGSERLRIKSSGQLTIPSTGRVGLGNASPVSPLQIVNHDSWYPSLGHICLKSNDSPGYPASGNVCLSFINNSIRAYHWGVGLYSSDFEAATLAVSTNTGGASIPSGGYIPLQTIKPEITTIHTQLDIGLDGQANVRTADMLINTIGGAVRFNQNGPAQGYTNPYIQSPGQGSLHMCFGYFGDYFLRCQNDRNVVLYNGTSAIWATGTSSSEKRLKKNINGLRGSREVVKKLRSVRFEYTEAIEDPGQKVGFIADDLMNIAPECVQTVTHPETGEETMLVREEKLVPFLVETIQEMSLKLTLWRPK
jgi:hypothetical protein